MVPPTVRSDSSRASADGRDVPPGFPCRRVRSTYRDTSTSRVRPRANAAATCGVTSAGGSPNCADNLSTKAERLTSDKASTWAVRIVIIAGRDGIHGGKLRHGRKHLQEQTSRIAISCSCPKLKRIVTFVEYYRQGQRRVSRSSCVPSCCMTML